MLILSEKPNIFILMINPMDDTTNERNILDQILDHKF